MTPVSPVVDAVHVLVHHHAHHLTNQPVRCVRAQIMQGTAQVIRLNIATSSTVKVPAGTEHHTRIS